MSERILCIDDDPNVLEAHERNLRKHFAIETISSPELALIALRERGPYAVILTDMRMPDMDGIEFLCKAREIAPDTIRTMLTGNYDQSTAIQAVNDGNVFRFITKPCPPELLVRILSDSLRQYQLVIAERQLLEQTLNGSVKLLTDILSTADPYAFGRAEILRHYTRVYFDSFKPLANSLWEVELASMLLNLGCVTIPDSLLEKARTGVDLAQVEVAMIKRIPEMGSKLLSNIPRLQAVAKIVRYQNKYYDGSGFPHDHVKGSEIPFGARLLKVLTDLLESETRGVSRAEAFDKIQKNRHLYDPEVLQSSEGILNLPPLKMERLSVQTISLKELLVSDVLASPLLTTEGLMLIPEGAEISNFILQKIHNFEALKVLKESMQVQITRLRVHHNWYL